MATISFKPKHITRKITSELSPRASYVIASRFGLTDKGEKKTLEEIGKKYNITRERVRQIEDAALNFIKKSGAYKAEQAIFEELKQLMRKLGSIVTERELLRIFLKTKQPKTISIFFLLWETLSASTAKIITFMHVIAKTMK